MKPRNKPQKPAIELPPNSNWIPVKVGTPDLQRHSTIMCFCGLCAPEGPQLYPVRQDFLTSGRSLCCRSCAAKERWTQTAQKHNRRKNVEVIEKTEDPNSRLKVTSGTRAEASQQSVFSASFLRSLKDATVASLKRDFHYKQPAPVEKVLAGSNLSMGQGLATSDEDARGKNLILAGATPEDISRVIKRNQGQRRVSPLGMSFDQYAATKNPRPSYYKLHLKFGPDKAGRRPKVRAMLCPVHGRQVVKSRTKGAFLLMCGCERQRDIKVRVTRSK